MKKEYLILLAVVVVIIIIIRFPSTRMSVQEGTEINCYDYQDNDGDGWVDFDDDDCQAEAIAREVQIGTQPEVQE